jgi:hypothetical protein
MWPPQLGPCDVAAAAPPELAPPLLDGVATAARRERGIQVCERKEQGSAREKRKKDGREQGWSLL